MRHPRRPVVVALVVVVSLLPSTTLRAESTTTLAPGETRVVGGGGPKYVGAKISLDFKDADVKDVLRFLADFGKFNLVLDETVQGKITLKLTDVPWDQALDIILMNNGLGADVDLSVVRAAAMKKLAEENAAQRRLQEEKALGAPLVTFTRTLSYAKAKDVAPLVTKLMSKRGSITVDARTNTLVIQEIPALMGEIEATVALADR